MMSEENKTFKRKTPSGGRNIRKSARLSTKRPVQNVTDSAESLEDPKNDTGDPVRSSHTKKLEFPAVVDLNVGGRHLTTSLSTLIKYPDSMLAAMFSGRHHVAKDINGRYFIDVDGDVFVHILNFLRLQTLPPPEKVTEVQTYADYFRIDELTKRLNDLEPSSEDSLFATWIAKIDNYPSYLDHLRQGLKDCDILSGYIYVQLSKKECLSGSCNHTINLIDYVNTDYTKQRCNIVDIVVRDLDFAQMRTLLTLLAHDIKKIGFYVFPLEGPLSCPCKLAKKFKVDACIEKYESGRFFV